MLEAISAKSRRLARQLLVINPTWAGGGEHGSKQRLALVPVGPGDTAPEEGEQGGASLPPVPLPRKPKRPPKRPETPETAGGSGSDSDTNTIPIPEELRFSPSETEESGRPVGAVPPSPQKPEGDGTGKAAESERAVEGGSEGRGNTLSRGGGGPGQRGEHGGGGGHEFWCDFCERGTGGGGSLGWRGARDASERRDSRDVREGLSNPSVHVRRGR
ncbi:unnamed protein product [Coccothraustes coccothraustes]